MKTTTTVFADLLSAEQSFRKNTINLNASENYTSQIVGKIQGEHAIRDNYHFSEPSHLMIEQADDVAHWAFSELSMLSGMRREIEDCFYELLGTSLIDPRPKGGQAAEIAVLLGLADRGDTIFVVNEKDGGHWGLSAMASLAGIHLEPVAFDHTTHQIDVEETVRRIREAKGPSIRSRHAGGRVVALQLSQSYALREQPLQDLVVRIREEDPSIKLAMDISHTMVLHMGGCLAQPLACGFDIIHGNTHKTFPGPQKAIIGFSTDIDMNTARRISSNVCPILQSNCGASEILSLGVAAFEMRIHARDYGKKIIANAQAFAKALVERGFRVVGESFGYTETHQVWMLGAGETSLKADYKRLEACGLRVNPAILPFTGSRWGLRMGTQGLTRRGLEHTDMRDIAQLMKRALLDREDPERVRADVYALMSRFPLSELRFRLDPDEERLLGHFSNSNITYNQENRI